jgi:excinuclease ABC subunit A
MDEIKCPECEGLRLKKEALFFKINEKNIAELCDMDILRCHLLV